MEDFRKINKEYDQLMMDLEADIFSSIKNDKDPLLSALVYARTGNYIDFACIARSNQKKKHFPSFKAKQKIPLTKKNIRHFAGHG